MPKKLNLGAAIADACAASFPRIVGRDYGQRDAQEPSRQLLALIQKALESRSASDAISEASTLLRDRGEMAAVWALHGEVQGCIERRPRDASDAKATRLVVVPVLLAEGAHPPCEPRLLDGDLTELQAALLAGMPGIAPGSTLALSPCAYPLAALEQANYDQLFDLMSASGKGHAWPFLYEDEGRMWRDLRYLVGVLATDAQDALAFSEADREAQGVPEQNAPLQALVSQALRGGAECARVFGVAPFFEGLSLGEIFCRDLAVSATLEFELNRNGVAARAVVAVIQLPAEAEEFDDEEPGDPDDFAWAEVSLRGMSGVEFARVYWGLLAHEDLDDELARLRSTLTRAGLRDNADPLWARGYGRA